MRRPFESSLRRHRNSKPSRPGLRRTQMTWRTTMEQSCATGPALSPKVQECRLYATLDRETEVRTVFADSIEPLVGPLPGAEFVPDEVEVFVPLPTQPRGGPFATTGVPIYVPLDQ